MRLFRTMQETILEIRRDLFKSPVLTSTRVQNQIGERTVREALGYTYSIPVQEIPYEPVDLASLGAQYFPYWNAHESDIRDWMEAQRRERLHPFGWGERDLSTSSADLLHPELVKMREGSHYAYTYEERLLGMWESMAQALRQNPDTRRAYWPIYQPLDALRAAEMTRIPCSLGYHFLIREQPLMGHRLHVVYLQRSANFQIFWLSDLWFASQILHSMVRRLRQSGDPGDLKPGVVTHTITSFHSFFDEEAEIF